MKRAGRPLARALFSLFPLLVLSFEMASPAEEIWVNIFSTGLRAYGLWADVQDKNRLYAATPYGLFSTDSAGRHWNPLLAISANWLTLAQSPSQPDTLFLGTSIRGDGSLLRSRDRGRSWEPVQSTLLTKPITAIWVDPTSPQTVIVLSGGELLKSLNGGRTWAVITPSLTVGAERVSGPIRSFAVNPANSAHLIAAGNRTVTDLMRMVSNLAESFDGGLSWQAKDFASAGQRGSRPRGEEVSQRAWDYLAFPGPDPAVLVGGHDTGGEAPLFISQDGGGTWTSTPVGSIYHIEVPPQPERGLYVAGDAGVSLTRDGGRTWQKVLSQQTFALAFTGLLGIYAATSEGMFKSVDGGQQWRLAGLGLPVTLHVVGIDGLRGAFDTYRQGAQTGVGLFGCAYENGRILVGGRSGYWETADSGVSWERKAIGLAGNVRQIECTQDGTLYLNVAEKHLLGGEAHIVSLSKDGRLQQIRVDKPPRLLVSSFDQPSTVFLTVREGWESSYLGPEYGNVLLKSDDGGFSWEGIDLKQWLRQEAAGADIVGIVRLAVAERNPSRVYAALDLYDRSRDARHAALLITGDGGESWRDATPPIATAAGMREAGEHAAVLRAIALADPEGKTVYVATRKRVAHSADAGRTWSVLPADGMGTLKDEEIRGVASTRGGKSALYVATERQVFRSRDSGRSWAAIRGSFFDPYLDQIYARGELVFLQGASGIYRLSDGDLPWVHDVPVAVP